MIKPTQNFAVISLALILLTGCATTQSLHTPSGRPEVTINTTDRSKIKSVILNELMNAGFTLISESEYGLIFSAPMKGFGGVMYQALLGNAYSSQPEWNIRINMAALNNKTRVVAQAVVRMQNAFGREDVNDMTGGKVALQLQQLLEKIKYIVEKNDK